MFEPLLQDYIDAALQMDRDKFCAQFTVPMLVTLGHLNEEAFQMARTFFIPRESGSSRGKNPHPLNNRATVFEMRQTHSTTPGEIKIGRAEENDIVLVEEAVSSRHAVAHIDPQTGACSLQDLESTNGTWINRSVLVPGRYTILRDGDIIGFGEIEFFFYYPQGLYEALIEVYRY